MKVLRSCRIELLGCLFWSKPSKHSWHKAVHTLSGDRWGVPDCRVSKNGRMFTSGDLQNQQHNIGDRADTHDGSRWQLLWLLPVSLELSHLGVYSGDGGGVRTPNSQKKMTTGFGDTLISDFEYLALLLTYRSEGTLSGAIHYIDRYTSESTWNSKLII